MLSSRHQAPSTIHQFKTTLMGIEPAIWRRVQVPSRMTLTRLHRVLQVCMGWKNKHLHQYEARSIRVGASAAPEGLLTLADLAAAEGDRFLYCYDFGDSWEHDVVVEKITAPVRGMRHPACLDGARACPPEDCGGPPGYAQFLEVMGDPHHAEHGEMIAWLGGAFDPDAFDREQVNVRLRRLRLG